MRSRLFSLPVALILAVAVLQPAMASDIEILTTPAGIEVWLKQEPSIPIVSIEVAFAGGASLDPDGREGLANMVTGLLDEGAGDLDSYAFQDKLDALSIRMSFNVGRDAFYGSLTTLAANLDEAEALFAMALNNPRFDEEPVERIRGQITVGLLRDQEDPSSRAWRAWSEAAFPGHPYGRPVDGTPDSVSTITADDLRGYVDGNFTRDRLFVSIVGAITPERATALVDTVFADLPFQGVALTTVDTAVGAGGVNVIAMDVPQSAIVFGLAGLMRGDPDYYAGAVLNKVVGGGGLSTRLFEEVRKKRGLAYATGSSLFAYDHAGLWVGSAGTQNARAGETLQVIRDVLNDVAENGVTDEEVDDAKAYMTGSFPLRLDSNQSIANMLLAIQLNDLGVDYIERRNDYIEAVTAEDIQRVARRILDADNLLVVVAGQPVGITPSVSID
ncbi:MAG: insulinase family protein [Rhodospirillales bacterium]|nr:insulinase family protein [Rhodospirillales bacterium]